jgi:hypothetical protein
MKERRLFKRYSCCLGGDFYSQDGISDECRISNISAMGAELITPKSLKVETPLKIKFFNKRKIPFILEGRIRWSRKAYRGWRAGVLFNRPLFVPLEMLV